MLPYGQDLRQSLARCASVGLAVALMAVTPLALGQKMHKCSDGAGGTTFQQAPCPETPQEAEARAKETERLKQVEAQKKAEEEKKKADALEKLKERDKLYQQQMEERAREAKKAQEVEKRVLEGTTKDSSAAVSDGTLSPEMDKLYPGPWRESGNADLKGVLDKNKVKDCEKYRYRQRVGGGSGEYLVHCTRDGTNWTAQYLVWLASGSVRGPYKL